MDGLGFTGIMASFGNWNLNKVFKRNWIVSGTGLGLRGFKWCKFFFFFWFFLVSDSFGFFWYWILLVFSGSDSFGFFLYRILLSLCPRTKVGINPYYPIFFRPSTRNGGFLVEFTVKRLWSIIGFFLFWGPKKVGNLLRETLIKT